MDLEALYYRVKETVSTLDLEAVWPGFKPLKFALFDNEKCFFDGRYIEKTNEFCANTSILYKGEQIATWMVQGELEIPVLASKLVHEMFHGFQDQRGWDCWPNELEALYRYEYEAENLAFKLRENELLLALLEGFDGTLFCELLSLRKKRSEEFPYQFSYETETEEIEGTAHFVEWQVLKQLDERKASELVSNMREVLTAPERMFPVRISCYYSGALMINAMLGAGKYGFEPETRPVLLPLLKNAEPYAGEFPGREAALLKASEATQSFGGQTDSIIDSALEKNEVVLRGPVELGFVNIYNARCRRGFITTTYFMMYRENGEEKMLPGDFVIKMRDERTVETVYRWERAPEASGI